MKVVAVANQKGGVSKTTTVVNLAAAIALSGIKTLVVDMDPQANATSGLGVAKADVETSVYAALVGSRPIRELIVPTEVENLFLVPAGIDLVGAEIELAGMGNRERRLAEALGGVPEDVRFVFLDCPPSLGLITLNALVASAGYLVPIQCEYYALEGLTQLMRTVEFVRERFNPALELEGILCAMYDGRSNLNRQVREEVERHFHGKTFRTLIPRNIKLAEAPGFGKVGIVYDPQAVGARAYKILADEFLQNNNIRLYQLAPELATPVGVN